LGPKSQKALNDQIGKTGATGNPTLAKIQKLLGVKDDGFWGPKSQQGSQRRTQGSRWRGGGNGPFEAEASSFADPKDVEDFKKCKSARQETTSSASAWGGGQRESGSLAN